MRVNIFVFKTLKEKAGLSLSLFWYEKNLSQSHLDEYRYWRNGLSSQHLCGIIFNVILQFFGYNFSSSSQGGSYPFYMLIVNVIFTAILPGLCEEVAHRGLVLQGLSPLGWKKAVIISGLLFGLMHMNIEQFFYATIIGLFVGWLSVGCGSIFPAIIVPFYEQLSQCLHLIFSVEWACDRQALQRFHNGFNQQFLFRGRVYHNSLHSSCLGYFHA